MATEGLYLNEQGEQITTNSMLSTFMLCPKQAQYKYAERLKPKFKSSKPLERGTWMHALLEAHYKEGDWEAEHKAWTNKYAELFDEEKEKLGFDLPEEIEGLMRSYLWHYANEEWIVHDVEVTLEAKMPNGQILRVKADLLVEDEWGLWLVDHKTHKRLPDFEYRIKDTQMARYLWVARKNKIPVAGFRWNYVKTEAIGTPVMLKDGSRLSKKSPQTDYPTMLRFIRENPWTKPLLIDEAKRLRAMRYETNAQQLSPFFQRSTLDYDPDLVKQVMRTTMRSSERMHSYEFEPFELVERNPGQHCRWRCGFADLCAAELIGGGVHNIRHQQFTQGDPLDYYERMSAIEERNN